MTKRERKESQPEPEPPPIDAERARRLREWVAEALERIARPVPPANESAADAVLRAHGLL